MTACADVTAGVISAESSGVTVGLTVMALGAPSVCDVVIQLVFALADNKVLTTNIGLLDIDRKSYNNGGVCFMLPLVGRGEPPRCLPLNQLGVVSCEAM